MQFELIKAFAQEGPLTLVVNGDCMQRTIPNGSRLSIEPKRTYWPGDALVYKRGDGQIMCHRFLGYVPGRNGWRVMTRADNTDRSDALVDTESVLGKVIRVDGKSFKPNLEDRAGAVLAFYSTVLQKIAKI